MEFYLIQSFKSAWIKKLILLFFCISILLGDAKASFSELTFDIFTQEDGLPNNQIQCIYQDSRGWIWIGTSQGLSRFDGYSFVNFLPNPDDSASLKGNLVRIIKEDSNGNLLIGTENGGLNIFNRELERFSHPLKNFSAFKFKDISVNDIEFDNVGNLFIGTDFNILKTDSAGKIVTVDARFEDEQESFEGNFVRNLQFDQNGILWMGTNSGLYTFNPETRLIESFDLSFEENQNRQIWEIYHDVEGNIWIGTEDGGVNIFNPETGKYEYLTANENDPNSISQNCIKAFLDDRRGNLWIGTYLGGIDVINCQLTAANRWH